MNRFGFILIMMAFLCAFHACKKDEEDKLSEKEILLTNNTWNSISLLADGIEAGGVGEILYEFAGETVFNPDGTGQVGDYTGTWELSADETQIIIISDALDMPLTANIILLTEDTLEIFTVFPDTSTNPPRLIEVEITFSSD